MTAVLSTLPPPRVAEPGTRLRFLLLAAGDGHCAGIDMGSGAFVRGTWGPEPAGGQTWGLDARAALGPEAQLRAARWAAIPFQVASAAVAEDDAPPDLARPEAVVFEGPPEVGSRLGRRRVERFVREMMAPPGRPLLGFPGSALPYWQVPGTHPSLSLLTPSRGPQLLMGDDAVLRARFEWDGQDHVFPVVDSRAYAQIRASGRSRLSTEALAAVLGHRVRYLLMALSGPESGHCYKTVAALLPRP